MRVALICASGLDRPMRRYGCGWLQCLWVPLLLLMSLGTTPAVFALQDRALPSQDTADSSDAPLDNARRRIAAGQLREALDILHAAVQADDGSDPRRLARRLGTLGVALDQAGAVGEAIAVQHQALALYESIDDPAGASAVTINLGNSLNALGDIDAARRYYQDALALKRRHGIHRGIGTIYNNLADLAEGEGDLAAARDMLAQALAAYAAERDGNGECVARANLARVLAKRGEHAAALEQIQAAEALARAQDSQRGILAIQLANGEVLMEHVRLGEPDPQQRAALLAQAEASLQQALTASRARADEPHQIHALEALARLHELRGEPAAALALARDAQARERAQEKRVAQTRAAVLSTRYEHARQQREIERLREHVSTEDARILRQRLGLWFLTALLLLTVGGVLALWRSNRLRRSNQERLREQNETLSSTLQEGQRQRQQVEAFALRQRRFLSLASEDLRGPLQEVRALAERILVDDNPDALRRQHAAIAQRASDLIWVADQMLESAEHELPHPGAQRHTEIVDLAQELGELVAQAGHRAIHRDQDLQLACRTASALVCIEKTRCVVALRELIDILLYLNPARTRFHFALEPADAGIRIRLDQGSARLPDWADVGPGQERGDVTLRLALAWIQHAIQDNGGQIATARTADGVRTEVEIRFPLYATGAEQPGARCSPPASRPVGDAAAVAASIAQAPRDRGSP